MKPTFLVMVLLAVIWCIPGESAAGSLFGKKQKKKYDCETQVAKAIGHFGKRHFGEVKTILDEVKLQCAGHRVIDTVFYYLGMAMLRQNQPVEARIEFERLIQDYPNSAYNEEAHFRLGQCSFLESNPYDRDQSKTSDAVRELQDFLDQFGTSGWADSAKAILDKCTDKLAHKEFATATLYYKQGQFEAAMVYYKIVINDFPASVYAPESALGMALALKKTNRISEAQAVLNEISAGQYPAAIKARAEIMLQRLNQKDRD